MPIFTHLPAVRGCSALGQRPHLGVSGHLIWHWSPRGTFWGQMLRWYWKNSCSLTLQWQKLAYLYNREDLHRLLRNMYLLFIFLSPFLVYVRSKNGEKSLKLGHFNIDRSFVIQIQESLWSDQWQFISMDETGEREMTGVRTGERKIASYCGNKNKNLSGTYAWSAAWIYLLLPYWRTVIQFLHKKSSSKYLAIKLK